MITSLNNPRIKALVELRDKSRARKREGCFIIEGFRMFEEAPLDLIKTVYIDAGIAGALEEPSSETPSNALGRAGAKLAECRQQGIEIESLSHEVFCKVSDTETPQGILALLRGPAYSLEDIMGGCVLVLEDIQDPGNLGTMLRTGEGAGISGVLLSRGCVDIFNPKTIRSTMGSMFRVPFVYSEDLSEDIRTLKTQSYSIYAAHLKGEVNYSEIKYPNRCAFLIGNEGNGLSDKVAALSDQYIRIPMEGKLESLNAAVSAALLMYEARR